VWVDRSGHETPASTLQHLFVEPSISPDGNTIVVQMRPTYDLWKIDLSRDAISRLTTYSDESFPIWSSDGKRVYYASTKDKSGSS
jgi:Tol biopolymer transport system component